MKNNRKLNRYPKILKPTDYIIAWRRWWSSLQPDWRFEGVSWPPSRDIPRGGQISMFAYSGPNGFFLIILSLSWWGKMVEDGLVDSDEFEMAVDDVHWVLSHVIGGLSCIPAKRPHDLNGDTMKPDSKRYVLLPHLIYKV
jgi:hypothetical protein